MEVQYVFKKFLIQHKISISSEQRYHLFHLLKPMSMRPDLFPFVVSDEALLPYGLSRKQIEAFRELCDVIRFNS
jgi:hypothetical protein